MSCSHNEIPELCTAYTPFRTRNRRKSPPALYCSQVAPSASNGHLRSDPAIRRMSKSLSARAAGFAVAACRFACFARRRRGLGLPARRPPSRLQMGGRRGPGRIGAGAQRFWRCGASKDPLAASVVRSRALFSERAVRFRDSTARPHPAGKARGAERTFLPGLTFSSADVRLETGGILVCLYLYESPYVASR